MKVMFHVQHLLGVGHIARASRIALALHRAGAEVTVVSGGLPVPGFPPPGPAHLPLPAIAAGPQGFAGLVDRDGRPIDDAFRDTRRAMLLDAFARIAPDVLLIEAWPFGRRQLRFELVPLVRAARARPRPPLIASSVRDILQSGRKPGRDEETVAALADFDAVLVHGDPGFARLEDSFPLAGRIADRLHYTGLVAPPPVADPPPLPGCDVLVSAGGGAVGARLIETALAARDLLPPALSWRILTGPNLPEDRFRALAARAAGCGGGGGGALVVERFHPDLARLMAGARLSLSQAGYNTVCDLLRAGCAGILVPFASGGETEQTLRANLLARRGLARVLPEEGLAPALLARTVAEALEAGPPPAALPRPDLEGAARTARLLAELLAARAPC